MAQFFRRRFLERRDAAALRVQSRHHVTDGAVLAAGVHSLQDDQQGAAMLGRKAILEVIQTRDIFLQDLARRLFLVPSGSVIRIAIPQMDSLPRFDHEIFAEVHGFKPLTHTPP